ncbi:DNRLRE domain-containing protein [Bradymonadales bacterium TMQ1]|nr:DNRLRE domain-containing protein [Bradymonadales bacterium TMQ1]
MHIPGMSRSHVVLAALAASSLLACNVADTSSEATLAQPGESCVEDEGCASGLCQADTQVCAARCTSTCEGDDLVCFEGHCLAAGYCVEGVGPGCQPSTCEPGCAPDATCDLEAADGPECVCDEGFEGDGQTCTPVEQNPCLDDNGGCGDPALVQCDAELDDDDALIAACTTINPCLDDNGGCGDPAFFECSNPEVGVGHCADIDFCATDNGGCGDPARYLCINVSGDAPLCQITAACDQDYEVPLLEDTFISSLARDANFSSLPFLVVHSSFQTEGEENEFNYTSTYEYLAKGPHSSLLKFDLSALPNTGPVVNAALKLVRFDGFYCPLFMNCQFLGFTDALDLVDGSWSANALTWRHAPEVLQSSLASWRIAEGARSQGGRLYTITSAALTAAAQSLVETDADAMALSVSSTRGRSLYYSSRHSEADRRPTMTVTLRECTQHQVLPNANATVSTFEPDTPLGEGGGLIADRNRSEFYVRFDMSDIPVGTTLAGAQLQLAVTDVESFGGEARFSVDYLVDDVWGESSVTYTNRPDAHGRELAVFNLQQGDAPTLPETITIDSIHLFEAVTERFEADRSITLRIVATEDAATFAGRTHADATLRPTLTLIYE